MAVPVVMVAAMARNGVIGKANGMPWHMRTDLKHFKATTMGKPMIMGRKTFESFPAPLPGRRHIVLTRDRAWRAEGAEVTHSLDEALARAGPGEVAVIGGAEIVALVLGRADRIELTEVHAAPEGDTVVPAFSGWQETRREETAAEAGRPGYAFVTLERDRAST